MIDTNALPVITDTAAQHAQSAVTSLNVIFMMAGGIVIHAYHTIVNGGGVRRIWSNFWNGQALAPIPRPATPDPQSPATP